MTEKKRAVPRGKARVQAIDPLEALASALGQVRDVADVEAFTSAVGNIAEELTITRTELLLTRQLHVARMEEFGEKIDAGALGKDVRSASERIQKAARSAGK